LALKAAAEPGPSRQAQLVVEALSLLSGDDSTRELFLLYLADVVGRRELERIRRVTRRSSYGEEDECSQRRTISGARGAGRDGVRGASKGASKGG
jgi:hypothetical protein